MTTEVEAREILLDCLDCGAELILVGAIDLGHKVTCPECGTVMEVVGLDPMEVDWIYDEPEYEDEGDTEDW